MRNSGKVLFIDEGYSLYNGDNDPYGMEALTTLNRYLSENPDKIIVIMAGYKDLIRDKLFTVQPGLRSRFLWQFECNGYNSQELYDIFLSMLKKESWTIAESDKTLLYDLISSNISNFKAFGRDIQRLIFFSQLECCESFVMNETKNPRELTINHINRAINRLYQNDIGEENNVKYQPNTIKDLLKIMNNYSESPSQSLPHKLLENHNDNYQKRLEISNNHDSFRFNDYDNSLD
jgi:hypothetical protein